MQLLWHDGLKSNMIKISMLLEKTGVPISYQE
jgi:hypothetical protein